MAQDTPPDGGPSRPAPAELGARVAQLREAAGLNVEDVAAATRIRAGLLRSIEAGDFAPCGGAVYARGHLRSIASVLHADGAELVATYDRMAGAPSPSVATIAEVPSEPAAHVPFAEIAGSPPPVSVTGSLDGPATLAAPGRGPRIVLPGSSDRSGRGSPLVLAGIAVAAVVVVVAAIALVLPGHHGSSGVTTARTPRTSAPAMTPPVPSPSPTAPVTLAYAGVNVTVRVATQASWVHVAGSGGTVFQGVLTPGTSKDFHDAERLTFVFGYAPAVDLVYNGRDIGHPPATKGNVANATFTPQSAD